MNEFEKQSPECILQMVESRDKWRMNTNFVVNGPHKQQRNSSKWLWKIHDTGMIEYESDEEEDSDSSSTDLWLFN